MAVTPGVQFWLDQIPNPDPISFSRSPDPWSVVFLGNPPTALPGLLENGDIRWRRHPHRNIDRGKKPGTDGANPKLLGVGIAEFDLPMIIWRKEQLALLSQIIPILWAGKSSPVTSGSPPGVAIAPGGGIPGAQYVAGLNLTQVTPKSINRPIPSDQGFRIDHPALTLAGIGHVLLEGWTPPVRWHGKNDVKVYTIHCLEKRFSLTAKVVAPTNDSTVPINAKTLPVNHQAAVPSAGPGLALGGG